MKMLAMLMGVHTDDRKMGLQVDPEISESGFNGDACSPHEVLQVKQTRRKYESKYPFILNGVGQGIPVTSDTSV